MKNHRSFKCFRIFFKGKHIRKPL